MELKGVIAELGLEAVAEILGREWASTQAALPQGDISFLSPDFLGSACRELGLEEDDAAEILAGGRRISENESLRGLAWHLHQCFFREIRSPLWEVSKWPTMEKALGRNHGAFYLVALISGLSRVQEVNRDHLVPEEIARQTLSELKEAIRWFKHQHGHAGLRPHTARWLALHFRGDLHRVGRFQYEYTRFWGRVHAFRHAGTGAVAALSAGDVRYRADGGAADEKAEHGDWTSRLEEGKAETVGNPVDPAGRVLCQEMRLPKAEWRQVLAPGQPVLNIHIPGDGKMEHQLCGDSLRAAREFYPRHFPDRPFNAFVCESWLLNTFIARLLPPDSNIVRLQREVYLYPIQLELEQLLREIYGETPVDWARAPRDNTFKRELADYFAAGGSYRPAGGGCFLFPQDLNWGAEVYIKQELPWRR